MSDDPYILSPKEQQIMHDALIKSLTVVSPQSDLTKRLRHIADESERLHKALLPNHQYPGAIERDAADELDRLTAELAKAQARIAELEAAASRNGPIAGMWKSKP